MSSDRDIRDRLAEALWRGNYGPYEHRPWSGEPSWRRDIYSRSADRLLAALPAVGLTLTALQSPTVKLKIERAE